jgi:DNA-directed RNA polymerase subunit beta'
MTALMEPKDGKVKLVASAEQAVYLFQSGHLSIREKIKTRVKAGDPLMETCVGRILLNRLFPKEIGFINDVVGTKQLADIVRKTVELRGFDRTARFLDEVKEMGFYYITKSGFSYGMGDLPAVEKNKIIEEGDRKAVEIEEQYREGLLTKKERYQQIIKTWSDVKDGIQKMSKESLDKTGPVFSMIDSGARGSVGQLTQVVGMKGLVGNPKGELIELPIKSSFREGLDVLEYFISTHGTRKGLTDTALKTANAGYLTRRLVDVAQDIIITTEDCGDTEGMRITIADCDEIGEPLLTRLLGRFPLKDIKDAETGEVLIKKNTLITEDHIRAIASKKVNEAILRSVLTCRMRRGLCQKCYGYDLAYNDLVRLGTAVGIVAAQSIGEPGTQLTMRTFHMGGAAGSDITQGLPRVEELFEARSPKHKALLADVAGKIKIIVTERRTIQTTTGQKIVDTSSGLKTIELHHVEVQEQAFTVGRKDTVKVEDGQSVKEGQVLILRDKTGEEVLSPAKGTVKVAKNQVVLVFDGQGVMEYPVPSGYHVLVKDGAEVVAGEQLTDGQFDLQDLFRLKGHDAVMRYLLREVLSVYSSQGQKLNAKHIEVMVRQMFSRIYVRDAGDTDLLPGQVVEKSRADAENERILGNKGAVPATVTPLFMGITKVALSTESFLSAASFMETARVLINAAVTGKVDRLEGLKENVIIGRLTPAGTGFLASNESLATDLAERNGEVAPAPEETV